jgi:serine/threonine protein kinase
MDEVPRANETGLRPTRLSDLVRDSRRDSEFSQGQVRHVYHVSNHITRQRRILVEEVWERQKELGNGTFGHVYLERCIAGPKEGQLRAVKAVAKDISTSKSKDASLMYERELEAMAKFSHEKVRP